MPDVHRRRAHAALLGLAVAAGLLAACGGGSPNYSPAPPAETPAPTAPPVPAGSAFTSEQSAALAATVNLPAAGGFGGSVGLPAGSVVPPGATIDQTITNQAPASIAGYAVPALQSAGRAPAAVRASAAAPPITVLFYLVQIFSPALSLPGTPTFTLGVPAAAIVPGAAYDLALYDPLRPSLGWQRGFAGPGAVSGTTVAFPAGSAPVTFAAGVPYVFALYAVSATAAAPTPAPSIAPLPAPSPSPSPSPTAAPTPFTLTPAAVSINAGATATATIADPAGCACTFTASTSSASIATATVAGTTVTIVGAGGGQATITVSSSDGRTAAVAVTVTQTNVSIQGARR